MSLKDFLIGALAILLALVAWWAVRVSQRLDENSTLLHSLATRVAVLEAQIGKKE